MNDNIENQQTEKNNFWKLWFVTLMVIAGFLIIIVRLFFVQVLNAERYQLRAREQHELRMPLGASRGEIYDKNMNKLVASIQGMSLAADPKKVKDKKAFAASVSALTKLDYETILDKIQKSKRSFVWLGRSMMPDNLDTLRTFKKDGLIIIDEPKRIYYYGSYASQILGCTNVDNIGITGLELTYDSLLKGTPGFMIMLKDGKGNVSPSADLDRISAINGNSLKLTLDIQLQQIVEYELMKGVERTKSESGTVIAINPKTGELLAMASYPGYDPNNMLKLSAENMRNRAITDVYEPGSTFKLITAASALEEKLITPSDSVDGQDGYADFGEYIIRDAHKIGKVTFKEALSHSSNVVFAELANQIPRDKLYKYMRDFGFGNTLGLDVIGELSGKLFKPKTYTAVRKRYLGHGYGLMATPLQIVCSYACVANHGILMKPYIVSEVRDNKDELIRKNKPEKIRRVITETTSDTLINMLVDVVENGTGQNVKIKGISIAGKTGTSQQLVNGRYSKRNYNASFAGFFPAEQPLIAMLVLLDKPRAGYYGGSTAAPIFKNIASRWISISPEFNLDLPEYAESDSIRLPNIKGFRNSVATSLFEKLELKIFNPSDKDQFIIGQKPRAGSYIDKNTSVTFTYEDELIEKSSKSKRISVKGLAIRRAISILHKAGIKVKVQGSGIVRYQRWTKDSKGNPICTLICR